jgi:hypothetical protein
MNRGGDITETKGLAAGFSVPGEEVFGGLEQPEEGKHNELDSVLLHVA